MSLVQNDNIDGDQIINALYAASYSLGSSEQIVENLLGYEKLMLDLTKQEELAGNMVWMFLAMAVEFVVVSVLTAGIGAAIEVGLHAAVAAVSAGLRATRISSAAAKINNGLSAAVKGIKNSASLRSIMTNLAKMFKELPASFQKVIGAVAKSAKNINTCYKCLALSALSGTIEDFVVENTFSKRGMVPLLPFHDLSGIVMKRALDIDERKKVDGICSGMGTFELRPNDIRDYTEVCKNNDYFIDFSGNKVPKKRGVQPPGVNCDHLVELGWAKDWFAEPYQRLLLDSVLPDGSPDVAKREMVCRELRLIHELIAEKVTSAYTTN